jgi:EAL domain-containing protein (putative c-di-GMP-specific phosphodiesterase class I)
MTELGQLHGAILEISDPLSIMRRVVEEALVLIPSGDGATVELLEADTLVYVCGAGRLAGHIGTRLRVDRSLSGLAATWGETLCCDDATVDPRVDREACLRLGAISMICVPLHRGADPIGVLKISSAERRAFSDDAVAIMAALAEFVSAAVTAATDLAAATASVLTQRSGGTGQDELQTSRPRADRIGRFVANVLQPGIASATAQRERVEQMLARGAFTIVAQPIVALPERRIIGVEALARFDGPPFQPTSVWFEQARATGLAVDLELACARGAIQLLELLPPDLFVAINLGPDALVARETLDLLGWVDTRRVVFELTEHIEVHTVPRLLEGIERLRTAGARLAIDDTGAGFATLDTILQLAPEIIKLDRSITHEIDSHPARRALARALMSFAREIGAEVIAEGIETADELDAVEAAGIGRGQGFLLGPPAPVAVTPAAALRSR